MSLIIALNNPNLQTISSNKNLAVDNAVKSGKAFPTQNFNKKSTARTMYRFPRNVRLNGPAISTPIRFRIVLEVFTANELSQLLYTISHRLNQKLEIFATINLTVYSPFSVEAFNGKLYVGASVTGNDSRVLVIQSNVIVNVYVTSCSSIIYSIKIDKYGFIALMCGSAVRLYHKIICLKKKCFNKHFLPQKKNRKF